MYKFCLKKRKIKSIKFEKKRKMSIIYMAKKEAEICEVADTHGGVAE
jgi:hypothetical protein